MNSKAEEELLTAEEAAKVLRFHTTSLKYFVLSDGLPVADRTSPNDLEWKYRREDLDRWQNPPSVKKYYRRTHKGAF